MRWWASRKLTLKRTKVHKTASVCVCISFKYMCIHTYTHMKARRLYPKCLKPISSLNGRVVSHFYFLPCVNPFLKFLKWAWIILVIKTSPVWWLAGGGGEGDREKWKSKNSQEHPAESWHLTKSHIIWPLLEWSSCYTTFLIFNELK